MVSNERCQFVLRQPVDDPVMWKLVALVQEQLPNSAHRARVQP